MNLLWVLARSAGVVSTVLLSATMVFGIMSSADFPRGYWSRWLRKEVHRRIALLACSILALHIVAVVLDSFVDIGWMNVVLPFSSTYDRLGVGFAAVALDLLLIVMATSVAHKHLPFITWQVIHTVVYLVWPVAILHGILSGTDDLLVWLVSLGGAVAVATVAAIRWINPKRRKSKSSPDRIHVAA